MDDCLLGSKKTQLNSFQVTIAVAFVLEVLSFKNIRCLKRREFEPGKSEIRA